MRRSARRHGGARRTVAVSGELVALVAELRADFALLQEQLGPIAAAVELRVAVSFLDADWVRVAFDAHPAVGPKLQMELSPGPSLRQLAREVRAIATHGPSRRAIQRTGTDGGRR